MGTTPRRSQKKVNEQIFNSAVSLLDKEIESCGSVFVIFFSLSLPASDIVPQDNNKLMSIFMNTLKTNLRTRGENPGYIWRRYGHHQKRDVRYVLGILLDGRKRQVAHEHYKLVRHLWVRATDFGHTWGSAYCTMEFGRDILVLHRDDQANYTQNYKTCLARLQEFAQPGDDPPPQVRLWSCSIS